MTSDQEPRYRLVDDEGNIVGSLYGKADGSIAIQETASGSDREVTLAPDGTFSAPSVETPSLSTERAVIEQFANSKHDYIISRLRDSQTLVVVDRFGEVAAGGEDNIGVSDSTDFAEVLQHTVNDLDSEGANHSIAVAVGQATCKSQADLKNAFSLWGPYRNANVIQTDFGGDVINIGPDATGDIIRFDSIKFDGRQGDVEPNRWFKSEGMGEILFTNVEMRNATEWAAEIIDADTPNYITNSWFINGAGLRIENSGQLSLMGNELRGETIELVDCHDVSASGNTGAEWSAENTDWIDSPWILDGYAEVSNGEINYNITNDFDEYRLKFRNFLFDSDSDDLLMQINGQSSDYFFTTMSESITSYENVSELTIIENLSDSGSQSLYGTLNISVRNENRARPVVTGPIEDGRFVASEETIYSGGCRTATNGLESIRLYGDVEDLRGDSVVRVEGRFR